MVPCKKQIKANYVLPTFRALLASVLFALQYGLQRILGDERSLLLLARAIDPKQTNMMTETVKILSAFCIIGEENM